MFIFCITVPIIFDNSDVTNGNYIYNFFLKKVFLFLIEYKIALKNTKKV